MQGYTDRLAPDGHPIRVVALRNANGCQVEFMDWGATWLSCLVPVGQSAPREVLLRSPNLEQHLRQNAYLGATIGRFANRINNATYLDSASLAQGLVVLHANDNGNSLHGGPRGFDSRRWQVESSSLSKVVFSLVSEDGDQGFPGRLEVCACYELSNDNSVTASFTATTDKPCPVNLTNHAYFNLASGHSSVLTHELQISADYYLSVQDSAVFEGGLEPVVGTDFDFRISKVLASEGQAAGYDHAFLLDTKLTDGYTPIARLMAPDRRMQLAIATTKPALQVYTGDALRGALGADGQPFAAHSGIALETEFLPDAPNHTEWSPSSILLPGQAYAHQTSFLFTALP